MRFLCTVWEIIISGAEEVMSRWILESNNVTGKGSWSIVQFGIEWLVLSDQVFLRSEKIINSHFFKLWRNDSPGAPSNAIVVAGTGHLNFKIFQIGHVNIVSIVGIGGSPEPVHIVGRKHWFFNNVLLVEVIIILSISEWFPANNLLCTVLA